jgi:hypothetical protein
MFEKCVMCLADINVIYQGTKIVTKKHGVHYLCRVCTRRETQPGHVNIIDVVSRYLDKDKRHYGLLVVVGAGCIIGLLITLRSRIDRIDCG